MIGCIAYTARIGLMAGLIVPATVTAHYPFPQINPPAQPVGLANLTPEERGDLALAHQEYIAAIEAYREAPQNSAEVWNKLGVAYHHLFALEEARKDYQHALHLRPNYPQALNNLGTIYYAKKDYRKAEKYYHRSLRLDPEASVYSNLGVAYFAQDHAQKGVAAFRAAFALDPHVFDVNAPQLVTEALPAHDRAEQDFCLARLFAQAHDYKEAITFLRRALDEGFDNRKELLADQTLAALRMTPQFTELMQEQKQPPKLH